MNDGNTNDVILEIQNLDQYFRDFASLREIRFNRFLAGINLKLYRNEVLGIVGESGCGKTTLGRCIVGLITTTTGTIIHEGRDVSHLSNNELKGFRRKVQMIFQNPRSSLNINLTVRDLIEEAVRLYNNDPTVVKKKVQELVKRLKLEGRETQYPHQLSGGERRRVGLARIMAVSPELIIADEPVSSLDVSIKGFIVQLILDYKKEHNATILFITHDMHLINSICDRIVVMFLGRIIEIYSLRSPTITNFHHPYTQTLISAAEYFAHASKHQDNFEPVRDILTVAKTPTGCVYYSLCELRREKGISHLCEAKMPELVSSNDRHQQIACYDFSRNKSDIS